MSQAIERTGYLICGEGLSVTANSGRGVVCTEENDHEGNHHCDVNHPVAQAVFQGTGIRVTLLRSGYFVECEQAEAETKPEPQPRWMEVCHYVEGLPEGLLQARAQTDDAGGMTVELLFNGRRLGVNEAMQWRPGDLLHIEDDPFYVPVPDPVPDGSDVLIGTPDQGKQGWQARQPLGQFQTEADSQSRARETKVLKQHRAKVDPTPSDIRGWTGQWWLSEETAVAEGQIRLQQGLCESYRIEQRWVEDVTE